MKQSPMRPGGLLETAGRPVIRAGTACRGCPPPKHFGRRRRQQQGGKGEELVQLVSRRIRGEECTGPGEELFLLGGEVNGSAQ